MRQDPSYFITSKPNLLSQSFTSQALCFGYSLNHFVNEPMKGMFAAQSQVLFLLLPDHCIHLHVLRYHSNNKLALIYFLTNSEKLHAIPCQRFLQCGIYQLTCRHDLGLLGFFLIPDSLPMMCWPFILQSNVSCRNRTDCFYEIKIEERSGLRIHPWRVLWG